MKITIIAVGKVKERFYQDAVLEFKKRLSRYCKLEIVELEDEKTPDGASAAEELKIKEKEGARILSALKEDMYVTALAIEGEQLSSTKFADKLAYLAVSGRSSVAFVIGGSLGLDERVLARADCQLSFSPMTFPHQLMRVILLEQIYRAFRINAGEPYHK